MGLFIISWILCGFCIMFLIVSCIVDRPSASGMPPMAPRPEGMSGKRGGPSFAADGAFVGAGGFGAAESRSILTVTSAWLLATVSLITSTSWLSSVVRANPNASMLSMPPLWRPRRSWKVALATRTLRYLALEGSLTTLPTKVTSVRAPCTKSSKLHDALSCCSARLTPATKSSLDGEVAGADVAAPGSKNLARVERSSASSAPEKPCMRVRLR
mmetsp:Transcript_30679/g.59163  ORF Transcript_30679/g.59163 Transcript_30679/m.59163 type:complete len:214 (+) Transcript_30679:771-1412(+)